MPPFYPRCGLPLPALKCATPCWSSSRLLLDLRHMQYRKFWRKTGRATSWGVIFRLCFGLVTAPLMQTTLDDFVTHQPWSVHGFWILSTYLQRILQMRWFFNRDCWHSFTARTWSGPLIRKHKIQPVDLVSLETAQVVHRVCFPIYLTCDNETHMCCQVKSVDIFALAFSFVVTLQAATLRPTCDVKLFLPVSSTCRWSCEKSTQTRESFPSTFLQDTENLECLCCVWFRQNICRKAHPNVSC